MAQLLRVGTLLASRPSAPAACLLTSSGGAFRHCMACCSTYAPKNDEPRTAVSLGDPSLTPHQRMALALRRKRETSKRVQKLPLHPSSISECVEILRSAPDVATVRKTMEQLENYSDFATLHTPQLQHLITALHELRIDTTAITQMLCSTLVSRLQIDYEIPNVLSTLLAMSRQERVPLNVLKEVDAMVCDSRKTFPAVVLGSAAQLFSRSKDYPRRSQVMEHLGVLINDLGHIHKSSLSFVLIAYQTELRHLLPRTYVVKVMKFMEVEFDRLLLKNPGLVVLAFKLLNNFDIQLSKEFILSSFETIRSQLAADQYTREQMLRVVMLLDYTNEVDPALVTELVEKVGTLDDKSQLFVLAWLGFITHFSITLRLEQQAELNKYLKQHVSFFLDTLTRRKSLLAYLSTARLDAHLEAQFLEELCERSVADMHSLSFSEAIKLLALLSQLPMLDFPPLIMFFEHLAVRLSDEGAFKRMPTRDLETLCFAVSRNRIYIPRLLAGLCTFIDQMATDRFESNPAESARVILMAFCDCGFLEDPVAMAAVEKMESCITRQSLVSMSDDRLIRLAIGFMAFQRFPRVVHERALEVLGSPSFSIVRSTAEDKHRLISFVSCLKVAQLNLPVPRLPPELITDLQDVMISRMCRLLNTARSRHLRSLVLDLVRDEDTLLCNVVSPSGYTVDVALLFDAQGRLARWADYDIVSDLDTDNHSHLDLEQKKIFPVCVDTKRALSAGLKPIAISAIPRQMCAVNRPTSVIGIISIAVWLTKADGWDCINVFESCSRKINANNISNRLAVHLK